MSNIKGLEEIQYKDIEVLYMRIINLVCGECGNSEDIVIGYTERFGKKKIKEYIKKFAHAGRCSHYQTDKSIKPKQVNILFGGVYFSNLY